jgi:hypothetical protein
LIIFDVDAHVNRTLVFVSPMNAFGCVDNVALWQVATVPTTNHFLEKQDYANEPQGQPIFPYSHTTYEQPICWEIMYVEDRY